jgi:MFS family permease
MLALTFFCISMAGNPAGFFVSKYLQEAHGWSPANVATLTFMGGALAIIGNPLGGWLSDRHGRRPIGAIFAFGYAVALLLFYTVGGLLLPVLWIAYVFFSMGTDVTLSAYRTELFPTSMRSSAGGATHFVSVTGGIVGLIAVSALYGVVGSTWTAILIVASLTLLIPIAIWFLFPETARRSLDEIAPDKLVEPTLEQ